MNMILYFIDYRDDTIVLNRYSLTKRTFKCLRIGFSNNAWID